MRCRATAIVLASGVEPLVEAPAESRHTIDGDADCFDVSRLRARGVKRGTMNEAIRFALLGLGVGALYAFASQGLIVIYRGTGVLNF